MSRDELSRYRESISEELVDVYTYLLAVSAQRDYEVIPGVGRTVRSLTISQPEYSLEKFAG